MSRLDLTMRLASASRVGAHALMRVAKRFFAKGMRHVISLSLMLIVV